MSNYIKPIEAFDQEDPLAPVGDESARASQALRDYAMMGSRRGLRAIESRYIAMEEEWKKNKARTDRPPTVRWMTISNWSVKYRWIERAKAYDEVMRLKSQQEFLEDQIKWRKHRLNSVKSLLSKAIAGLQNFDPSRATLSEITRALEIANNQLRIEFGEEKQIKSGDITITVRREDMSSQNNADDS